MAINGLNTMYRKPLGMTNDAGLLETYYNKTGQQNPVATTLGGQNQFKNGPSGTNVANTSPTPAPTTRRIALDPTTGRLTLDGQLMERQDPRMWGSSGQYLENQNASFNREGGFDSRYYQPTQVSTGDGSFETRYTLRPEVLERLNGRVQLNQSGVGGGGDDGYHEVIDPSLIEWDDEFGMVTTPDNIRGQDPTKRRQGIMRGVGVVGALAAPAIYAAAAGAGAVPEAVSTALNTTPYSSAAIPTGVDLGTGVSTVTANGTIPGVAATAPLATTAAAGGGAGVPTAMLEGYMPGATAATGTAGTSYSIPQMIRNFGGPVSGLLQGYLQNRNNSNYQNNINNIAQGADPWGPYRSQFANMLQEAYKNPESMMEMLRNTPGYQFTDQQGRQAIARKDTKDGYFRSSKLDYDLAEFSSGLASKTWDAEIKRIMQMAGVNIDPNNSANMRAGAANTGAQSDQQMWNNILGGVTDPGFLNWLSTFFGP